MAAHEDAFVDGDALREVMRRVPAPVVIVTVAVGDVRRGITIGSMTSVSLDPPLIAFNVQKEAETHNLLLQSGRIAVNILTEEQASLAHHFSIPDRCGPEQFDEVPYTLTVDGIPVLEEVLAVIMCVVRDVYDASDHSIFVAELEDIPRQDLDAFPLIYFDQTYRGVGDEVKSIALFPVNRESRESP